MAKGSSSLLRLIGLVAVVVAVFLLVVPPIREKRSERRIRTMLLEVQEALQKYHVEEELYPKKMMQGRELVTLLVENEFLEKGITNPWTGKVYADEANNDWLRYRTDGLAETYELIVLYPDTETEQFRLDSTANQSLEE